MNERKKKRKNERKNEGKKERKKGGKRERVTLNKHHHSKCLHNFFVLFSIHRVKCMVDNRKKRELRLIAYLKCIMQNCNKFE